MFFKTDILKNFTIRFQIKFHNLMIGNLYFRVMFYQCKIRPRNRKNFAIDRSEFLQKRWFFVKQHGIFSSNDFVFYLFFLLFNYFPLTEICKQSKLQRRSYQPQIEQYWFHILANTFSPEAVARSSFVEKAFLKYFAKFIGKHLCRSLFFNKVADLRP